ncbi:zinc metalloproteinase nas-14-like [Ylistrum balloti]|uniref:zinc metalloproteinase nas-14-like n=1 Tax=Ylistrum balloti TaxID=509963 RepID=UPI0029059B8A|nr:zinc metalloproteinase nas-14-like [Ylistrum balloti]
MTQDTRHSELMRTKSTLLKKLHKILTRKLKSSRSIDEVIEAASEPGTFTSATFIPDQEAIAFEGDMLMLIPQFACRSYVGMSVRNQHSTLSQDMILSRRCRSSAVFSHEILHVLGLFHEHSRPDRDEYVDIQLQNTIGRSRINFNRIGPKNINSRGVDYDYLSLMHYGSKAFSKNGNYTIVPRPDNNRKRYLNQIGRSRRISKGDARVINLMYRCRMPRPSRPTCSKYPYRL